MRLKVKLSQRLFIYGKLMKALEMLSKTFGKIYRRSSQAADVVVKAWNSTMEFFSNMWDGTKRLFESAHG